MCARLAVSRSGRMLRKAGLSGGLTASGHILYRYAPTVSASENLTLFVWALRDLDVRTAGSGATADLRGWVGRFGRFG